ncbi:MAG: 50S ribosomal protein L9 [Alphaproteobacteria bacterium GM202ARS2]|nr:50S ribosomal protein L9 [Alphaproteobacteria bacterium GM202ARS2]
MKIKLVLLERMMHLGAIGDLVEVKRGYAANYLLPQKKALRATKENIAYFESQLSEIKARNEKAHADALALAETLQGAWLVLVRQAGESGQLYGSVTARDVVECLSAQDTSVSGSQIFMDGRIKEIGIHTCRIALHPEVIVDVTLNVARSEDAAATQEKEEKKRIKAAEEAAQKAEKKNKTRQKNKKQRTEKKPTQKDTKEGAKGETKDETKDETKGETKADTQES